MGFFDKIIKTIVSASRPVYKFENNQIHFKINDDYISHDLNNYDMKTRHDSYVQQAYTINNEDIFLEYIKLDMNSSWFGEPLSVYEGFFKEKLAIRTLQTLENKEISNYVFQTKKVNDSFVLHFINIYSSDSNAIIVDTKGELYKKLLSCLDSSYEYKFEDEEKGSVNFNISIVKENAIRGYIRLDESDN